MCELRLKHGWPTSGSTLKENLVLPPSMHPSPIPPKSYQLLIVSKLGVRLNVYFPLHSGCWSTLNLHEACAYCYNRRQFICAATLLYLGGTVFPSHSPPLALLLFLFFITSPEQWEEELWLKHLIQRWLKHTHSEYSSVFYFLYIGLL